jgi:hypothetical protein
MLVRLDGHFVAAPPARPYSFTPDDRDELLEGTTRNVWVHQDDAVAPVVVKFDDDHADAFEKVRALATFGIAIAWQVESARSVKFRGFIDAP